MYIENPKTKNSGIICCIPQTSTCPNHCDDCFYASGRSYLEPLKENLPNIPPLELTENRIVRINDGNDSSNERELVESVARTFENYFFNTAVPEKIEEFSGPVVLTVNPGDMTEKSFHRVSPAPYNLMFVRVRVSVWNLDTVVTPAVEYYTTRGVPVVLTYMAYSHQLDRPYFQSYYEWKTRTLNEYWVLNQMGQRLIEDRFLANLLVYSCGGKLQKSCRYCGNCMREYFVTKQRML
jgi:hypothetical protein